MCGIAGVLQRNGAVERNVLERMGATLKHRGPDDSGVFASGPVGLAHTRLSIIDLSAHGHQPMASEDGDFVIAYNGEIYNHLALREDLEARGHGFRGRSDTEVALRAYMEWGEAAFAMFDGMFALVIWDGRRRVLQLARDAFGIKPLYVARTASAVVFGSEIKAVLASGMVGAELSWAGLGEYLHFDTPLGANTIFGDIGKLPPGQLLTVSEGDVRSSQFASILAADPVADDFPTAAQTVRELLEGAVESHLMSDVPVGVFLSGGIDSSALVAFASQHDSRLSTYAVGFDGKDAAGMADELPAARQVADLFGTDHHELRLSGADLLDVVARLVRCHDEPFGDPAGIPLYMLGEQLRGSVKVVLQGDGGDEVFGGYPRYVYMAHVRSLGLLSRASRWLHALPRHLPGRRELRAFRAVGEYKRDAPVRCMAQLVSTELPHRPPSRIFSAGVRELLREADPPKRYRELAELVAAYDPVKRMLYTDSSIILPDVYFAKVDRATMAHGIEVRVPMVDRRLAAYAFGLPSAYKVHGRQKKRVLRQALRGIVPDAILDRPKTGFGVPMNRWLRTSLLEDMKAVLFDAEIRRAGLFDQAALEICIREHAEQRRDNGTLLYKALNLALWYREYRPAFGGAV